MLKVITTIGSLQIIAILINIVRSKATAVILGPEGVGVISVVDQTVNFVLQLSAFSLPFASLKFLSRSHSRGEEIFRQTFAIFFRLLVTVTVLGTIVAVLFVVYYPSILGERLVAYKPLLLIGLISIPVMALQGFYKHAIAAAGEPNKAAVYDIVIVGFLAVGVIVGILLSDVTGYFIGLFISGLLLVAVTARYLSTRMNLRVVHASRKISDELRENPDILPFAGILYVTAFITPLALLIARYSVLEVSGEIGAGLLQAAIALSLSLYMVLGPTNGLYLTPILNRDIPRHEKLTAALTYQNMLIIAIGTLAAPIVLFPDWLLMLLFSPEFVGAADIVYLFVVAQVILIFAGVYQAMIIGFDSLRAYGIIIIAGHLLFGALAWTLVPMYEIHGVAYGYLIANTMICLTLGGYLFTRFHMRIPSRTLVSFCYILAALTGLGLAATVIGSATPGAIAIKVLALGGFLLSLLFLLTKSERTSLRNLVRRSN